MDTRILPAERDADGACADCGRRHKHRDGCPQLRPRWKQWNDDMRAAENYPVAKVYLCERCGVPLMGVKHSCRTGGTPS